MDEMKQIRDIDCSIIRDRMEKEDEKEFEETYLHFIYDKFDVNERYHAVRYFFMESRRSLRESRYKDKDQFMKECAESSLTAWEREKNKDG